MIWLLTIGIIALIQLLFGAIAIYFRTDKVTDLAYGGAFFIVVLWLYLRQSNQTIIHSVLLFLILLRSMRIATYLFLRVVALGKDKRFDGIRENKKSFAKFWLLQTVAIVIILIPTIATMHVASANEQILFTRYSFLGACVALLGLYIESIADRQKFQFKRQYPTKRCNIGLWSKARYPNYFGEMLFWIGIYGVALSGLQGIQVVVGLLSPCIIIRLLLFVTGIPPLEKEHEQKWGQDLERRDYEKKTNLLFPR